MRIKMKDEAKVGTDLGDRPVKSPRGHKLISDGRGLAELGFGGCAKPAMQ